MEYYNIGPGYYLQCQLFVVDIEDELVAAVADAGVAYGDGDGEKSGDFLLIIPGVRRCGPVQHVNSCWKKGFKFKYLSDQERCIVNDQVTMVYNQ